MKAIMFRNDETEGAKSGIIGIMLKKRAFSLLGLLMLGGLFPLYAWAAMTSESYQVPWDAFSAGGEEQGSSASYRIDDSIGGLAGSGESVSYSLNAGYRLGDERALSFFAQMAPGNGTVAAYGSLDVTARTVTLSGVTLNPFAVGDYVVLTENPGLSQLTAVGRVTAVAGSLLTLDRLDGQAGSMSASPSVGRVTLAGGGNISLGELSVATGGVASGVLAVQATTPLGYTLYAQSTSPLISSTGHTFASVSDGAVTAGSEEYGMRTHGTRADLAEDTAVTLTPTAVQSSDGATTLVGDRTAFLYKLALSASTPAGTYSQALFFTLTANY